MLLNNENSSIAVDWLPDSSGCYTSSPEISGSYLLNGTKLVTLLSTLLVCLQFH